jgi:hypothetical protein
MVCQDDVRRELFVIEKSYRSRLAITTNGWRLGAGRYETSCVYNLKCFYEDTNVY